MTDVLPGYDESIITDDYEEETSLDEQYSIFLRKLLNKNYEEVMCQLQDNCEYYGRNYEEADNDFNTTLGVEVTRRIKDIAETKDTIGKNRKQTRLVNWLYQHIPDRKKVESTIAAYSIEQSPAEFFTVQEALDLGKDSANNWLVNGLLGLGQLILLPAPAKVGKSILVSILSNCVQLGKPFLNRTTTQGNVLYIQNEENIGKTTSKRIYNGGLRNLELENYDAFQNIVNSPGITICRNLDIALDQDLIVHKVKEHDFKLVLIDSLNASLERSGLNDKSIETAGYLYRLQRLAHLHDFTVVILHHTTKMDNTQTTQGMMDGIAGRSDVTRANDGIFRLSRVEDKETHEQCVQLNTIPRDGDPITIQYRLVKGIANRIGLQVLNESIITPENLLLQNKILRLLFDRWHQWTQSSADDKSPVNPYGYTLVDLVRATGAKEEEVIARTNDMEASDGIISYVDHSIGKDVFAIEPGGESWLTHYLEEEDKINERKQEKDEQKRLHEELININLGYMREAIEKSDDVRLRELHSSLEPQVLKTINTQLTVDEKNDMLLIFYPPTFPVGTKVKVKNEDISLSVVNVVYKLKDKVHLYYLEGIPDRPFEKHYLTTDNDDDQTDSEITDNGDL